MKSVIVITRHSYQIWWKKKWQMIETKWNETNKNECTCTLRIEMENRVFAHRHSLPLSQICNTLTRFTSYIVCSYPWCESQKYFLLSPDDSTRRNDNRAECGFCNILTAIKVKGLKLVTIWIQNDSIYYAMNHRFSQRNKNTNKRKWRRKNKRKSKWKKEIVWGYACLFIVYLCKNTNRIWLIIRLKVTIHKLTWL